MLTWVCKPTLKSRYKYGPHDVGWLQNMDALGVKIPIHFYYQLIYKLILKSTSGESLTDLSRFLLFFFFNVHTQITIACNSKGISTKAF